MLRGGWNTFWVDTECLSERDSASELLWRARKVLQPEA